MKLEILEKTFDLELQSIGLDVSVQVANIDLRANDMEVKLEVS